MAFIYWRIKNSARLSMGCVYHHHHLLCIGFWRTPLQWGMSANDATAEQSKLQAERGTRRSATSCGAARVATGIASLHLTIQTTKATLPLVGWLAGWLPGCSADFSGNCFRCCRTEWAASGDEPNHGRLHGPPRSAAATGKAIEQCDSLDSRTPQVQNFIANKATIV